MPTVALSPSARATDDPTSTEEGTETSGPTRSDAASPEPSGSARPSVPSQGGGGSNRGGGAIDEGGAGPILALVESVTDAGIGLEVFGLIEGNQVWFVPAAAVGVPGLLIILWVGLQALGTLVWIPAVRRMRGDEHPRRRRIRA